MSANPNMSSTLGGGGAGSSGGGRGGRGPCGACRFLRRKCVPGCIFAPYFVSEQGAAHFAAVHKVFGASNVSKLLRHIPFHRRLDTVVTICYEAQARLRDPVYGCVSHIRSLQQQVMNLQAELSYFQAHLAALELPLPPPPPPPPLPPQTLLTPPPLSTADIPPASSVHTTHDFSSIFEPMVQPSWTLMQQRQMDDPLQFSGTRSTQADVLSTAGSGYADLQALARELLHGHESPPLPCTSGDASPFHHSQDEADPID